MKRVFISHASKQVVSSLVLVFYNSINYLQVAQMKHNTIQGCLHNNINYLQVAQTKHNTIRGCLLPALQVVCHLSYACQLRKPFHLTPPSLEQWPRFFCSHPGPKSAPRHIAQTSCLCDWTQLSYVTHLSIFQSLTVPFLHTTQVMYDVCCVTPIILPHPMLHHGGVHR